MPIRILNLEDDPHDSELVRRELDRAGLDVVITRVQTLGDFESVVRNDRPDLILSDHNLGTMQGRQALEIARDIAPELPFILLTGSLSEEAAVEYMKSGASDYILKDRMARLGPAVLDALQRARERQALGRYQEFLRQIVDTNPSVIFVRDRHGKFLLANRAAADAYGTTTDIMVGNTETALNKDPGDATRSLADDRDVLMTGRARLAPEYLFRDPAGNPRFYHVVKVPLLLPGDDDSTVLVVATDITERKRLEDQFRQAQKMEAVGQLAGGVAHDFNNILTAILGHTELLLDRIVEPDFREDLDAIRGSAQHAASLTRQLLAFSRKQILQPRDISVNDLVSDMEKMCRRLLAANIEIILRLAPDLGTVRADPAQLGQVLLNLVVNARDAMPEGGKLLIATSNVDLDQHYVATHLGSSPGPFVALVVGDTGVGMDEATRARAFEPFFTTKGPGRGTGLGLSTVYGIVKQSGGSIWVYSEAGKGTTFRIFLPRVDAVPQQSVRTELVAAPGGSETILLVEDAEAVRRLSAQVLRRRGYTVIEAVNGAEAQRVSEGHAGTIDLLLTDVVMPGISGSELARRLTAARRDLRVLFTSGYTDDAVVHHGVQTPEVAFLQKPFAIDDLLRAVRKALDAPINTP